MRLIDADALDDILADGEIKAHKSRKYVLEGAINTIRGNLAQIPSVQPEWWIPVKTRPMDEEERAYWSDYLVYDIEYEDAVTFDCQMPEDGQEILTSFRNCVGMDKCEIDDGFYGLEGNGDWDGVIAWMPLPEPYKGEQG